MWSVQASGKASDVRTSISKQFTAAAATAPSDRTRASAASFIDGVLAALGATLPVTVAATGTQGTSHPDGGAQNNITINIQHLTGAQG